MSPDTVAALQKVASYVPPGGLNEGCFDISAVVAYVPIREEAG